MASSGELPVDPVQRYNEILVAYQKMKQRAIAFKNAAQSEHEQHEAAAAKVADLEAALARKDIELKQAEENNERLEFNNQSLTKRIEALQGGESEDDSSSGGGWFGFGKKASAEIAKLKDEAKVLKEELVSKIEENAKLHLECTDQKERFNIILSEKNAALLDLQHDRDEKLAAAEAALRRSEDNARKLAEGKLATDMTLASVRVELEAAKKETVDQQIAMQKEIDGLRDQLAALQKRHDEQVVFDDRRNEQFARFDCLTVRKKRSFADIMADKPGSGASGASSSGMLKETARSYMKFISQSLELGPSVPYEEALKLRDTRFSVEDDLRKAREETAALKEELKNLKTERDSLETQLKERPVVEVAVPMLPPVAEQPATQEPVVPERPPVAPETDNAKLSTQTPAQKDSEQNDDMDKTFVSIAVPKKQKEVAVDGHALVISFKDGRTERFVCVFYFFIR